MMAKQLEFLRFWKLGEFLNYMGVLDSFWEPNRPLALYPGLDNFIIFCNVKIQCASVRVIIVVDIIYSGGAGQCKACQWYIHHIQE